MNEHADTIKVWASWLLGLVLTAINIPNAWATLSRRRKVVDNAQNKGLSELENRLHKTERELEKHSEWRSKIDADFTEDNNQRWRVNERNLTVLSTDVKQQRETSAAIVLCLFALTRHARTGNALDLLENAEGRLQRRLVNEA
jgi:flagellar biosynthesis/type III secretory pathway M-ring protein FliF/YscJ